MVLVMTENQHTFFDGFKLIYEGTEVSEMI